MSIEGFHPDEQPEGKLERESKAEIRRAQPADIIGINSLYHDTYGADYRSLSEDIVLNSDNDVYVAVNAEDQVIGVAKSWPAVENSHFREFGGLVVHPDHQGQGIARVMTEMRLQKARERGARGIFSEPVCFRPNCESQHNLVNNGFLLTGLSIAKSPHMRNSAGQPETDAMACKFLAEDTFDFGNRKIYLPHDYEQLLEEYFPPDIINRSFAETLEKSSPSVVEINPLQTGESFGSSFADIPINWRESLANIEKFREQGYLFAGILPGVYEHEEIPYDALRMYKPPAGLQVDFNSIYVHPQLKPLWLFMQNEFKQKYGSGKS